MVRRARLSWTRPATRVRFPGSHTRRWGRARSSGCWSKARGAAPPATARRPRAPSPKPSGWRPTLTCRRCCWRACWPITTRAIDALARAEARRPSSCRAPYERGLRELARGDQTAAAAAFERACTAAPAFGAAQERLGRLAELAGRSADAVRLYEEAALQNPSFALPVARLAVQAQRRGEIARAVALLERALAADPELPLTHFLLGRAYLELGRLHQARAHLERAEAEEPSGWPAHLPDGFSEAGDRAATMAALARAENRG